MRSLVRILLQQRKNNAVLVGEAGVGKTGVVEGLAQRQVGSHPITELNNKRIVEVSMSSLVAGAMFRGSFEARMQKLVEEAKNDSNLILFIDEIHTLMGAGGDGSSDAANILKPALARGEIRCIGATTVAEYRKTIEKDSALSRRFQVVWIDEPTRSQTIEILQGIRSGLEEHHGLAIDDEAIDAAVDLSIRHLHDSRLPDKAIDLLDQAGAAERFATISYDPDSVQPLSGKAIGRSEIVRIVADRCRIPIEQLSQSEFERLRTMEDYLSQQVMGQQAAISAVSNAVRTSRAGLKNPQRPTGVFLFMGNTGTGKTELSKGERCIRGILHRVISLGKCMYFPSYCEENDAQTKSREGSLLAEDVEPTAAKRPECPPILPRP